MKVLTSVELYLSSVYQEKQIHPARVGPSSLSPSFQKADRWKTWCFSSYWTCGGNLGCCWSCCHLPRDWRGQRESLKGWIRIKNRTVFDIFNAPSPAKLPGVVQHRSWMGEGHPVQAQCTRGGRRRGVDKSEGPVVVFVVLKTQKQTSLMHV